MIDQCLEKETQNLLSLLIFKNFNHSKNFIMDGKIYRAAHFATQFRKSLMAEHLGLNEEDPILNDPVDNQLFSLIRSRAYNNTEIYRSIFSCYPDDIFTNYKILNNTKKMKEIESPHIFLQNYHYILFNRSFLCK